MKEVFEKTIKFIKRFSKEIFIALILAVIAAIAIGIITKKIELKRIDNNRKAVAMITAYDKNMLPLRQGSGFFISSDGVLVTNKHVVEGANHIEAKLLSGAFYKLKRNLGMGRESDFAILQFEASGTPSVKMGDSDNIKAGEKVYAIGSPMGLESTVSEGTISHPKRNLDGMDYIQFTAPISSGSSGGCLLDESFRVIGITGLVAIGKQGGISQNLNFAIPINMIKRTIKGEEKRFTDDNPDFWYSKGMLAENKKEYDKAIEYFKKAIEKDKKYVDAYTELGFIYYERGSYEEELEWYKQATQLDSKNSDAYYYLATAYEDKGLYDAAINSYEKVLEIKPDYKDAIYSLGILYIVQGEKNKALELIPRLTKLNPGLGNELKKLLDRVK